MDWDNIVSEIINGVKSPNCIVDIEEQLLGNDTQVVLSSIKAIQILFCHFLSSKEINLNYDGKMVEEGSQEKYRAWLKSRYDDFKNHLIDYLHHDEEDIQKASLETLIQFVKLELDNPPKSMPDNKWCFPKEFYSKIIYKIIQSGDQTSLFNYLQDYLEFYDVKFYTLKSVSDVLGNKTIDVDEQLLRNIFILLCKIKLPKKFPDEQSSENFLMERQSETGLKSLLIKETTFRSLFSSVWIMFLKETFSRPLLRKVLLCLPSKVLPHLNNPLLLTDLLTDAYNSGGIISLLALNGIFFLMQNHNLEYPDFFKKFYSLLDVDVIKSKYRARFFFLSDLFLSSILLPEYIVAAFVKKLSRLTLYATPDVLLIMLPLIKNLIIRHPGLKILIHRPQTTELKEDPFNFDESLENCNALQSSLWEIKALQNHWHPNVATKAKFINTDLGVIEIDLSSVLDMDFDELIAQEKASKFKNCPLSIETLTKCENKLCWTL